MASTNGRSAASANIRPRSARVGNRKSSVGPTASGKLPVAEPTSVSKFAIIFMTHICKKVLLIDPLYRFGIYVCAVTVVSLVTDLVPPLPISFFTNKRNFFNTYMVQFGWGWTFSTLAGFIYYTSNTYCCGDKFLIKKHLARLLVGTFWWFFCTTLFGYIENVTGFCSTVEIDHYNKKICVAAGGTWKGFDISGHAFLLIFCSLLICEEAKCIYGWERIPEILQDEEDNNHGTLTKSQIADMRKSYTEHLGYVRGFLSGLTMLVMVWDVMLMSTVLYFHNMPQKLIGTLFAGLGWYITYRGVYNLGSTWCPELPGSGLFKYMNKAKLYTPT